jgi:hypothetical protein
MWKTLVCSLSGTFLSVFGGFVTQGQSITQGFEDVPTMLSTGAPFSQTSVLTLDGAPITVSQVDIVGTPGASNVTITNSTISKMTAEGTAIAPLDKRHAR